ncbi:potassium-transporting ATPase subunit F, partial [Staphylococcus aureus]
LVLYLFYALIRSEKF